MLGAAILGGLANIWIKPSSRVLYLGDVCGITVLQLSDLVGPY
ncbi:fibrillarin [Orobanche hederae]